MVHDPQLVMGVSTRVSAVNAVGCGFVGGDGVEPVADPTASSRAQVNQCITDAGHCSKEAPEIRRMRDSTPVILQV